MTMRTRALATAAVAAIAGLTFGVDAAEVTYERLLDAQNEPQNWLLPYGSYDNHNHSNLSQINRSNVADLKVKFLFSIGGADVQVDSRFQSTPAVNDGFMYIANPWGKVFKVDVRSGTRGTAVWVNDSTPDVEDTKRMRGSVALLGNYVYSHPTQGDMRLLKIDAESGETVWEVSTLAPEEEAGTTAQKHSVQPIAVKDKLIVATTGTIRRNFIAAYSADDGALLWRFWTIPGPGEPGHETWGGDWEAWRTGGAAVWTQGAFDPSTNVIIYGTGEPSPWYDASYRPGDNLYAVSTIAIDVDTGKLAWHFQEIPDESWDYDNVNPHMLYNVNIDGTMRNVVAEFSRNGHYYSLDRNNGNFISAKPYTEVNWTAGLDPKTGMPVEYDASKMIQAYGTKKSLVAGDPETSQNVCPYFYGMPTLMPPTYDTKRMTAFVGAQEGCFSQSLLEPFEQVSHVGQTFGGAERFINGQTIGTIWAIDVRTGDLVSKTHVPHSIYSGTLGTSGDLLFAAQLDGTFSAFDKDTLSELWSFNAGTPISAPPISYMVDGKQYVAILAGGQDQSAMAGKAELALYERSPSIIVFGL